MHWRIFSATTAAALSLSSILSQPAQATYIATFNEVGPNVVAIGSGSFNLAGLIFASPTIAGPAFNPSSGFVILASAPSSGTTADSYSGISGPTSFGIGGNDSPDTGSGPPVGIFFSSLIVPSNYISGAPIGLNTNTWNNASFASLGVAPGTYTWSWGSGSNADSFTLQIGPGATNGVPESSSTLPLLAAAIGGLCLVRRYLVAARL